MRLALRSGGLFHSRRRIVRQMAERSLKPWTADGWHDFGYDANVLATQAPPSRPREDWVSDTTYIKTGQGWAYLAATMDLHSRYIVGWSLSASNDTELAVSALEKARSGHGGKNLLRHGDRGSTYASNGFRQSLRGLEATAAGAPKAIATTTRRWNRSSEPSRPNAYRVSNTATSARPARASSPISRASTIPGKYAPPLA